MKSVKGNVIYLPPMPDPKKVRTGLFEIINAVQALREKASREEVS